MAETAAVTPRPQAASAQRETTNPIPSSSPAFGTPAFPIVPRKTAQNGDSAPNTTKLNFQAPKPATAILPVLLPPQTLRPIAFRTITKKHNLTLTSPALGQLAAFVGKYCGSGWREEGLAERVLDEVAKTWKRNGGGLLLEDGKDKALTKLLRSLEECMSGGKLVDLRPSPNGAIGGSRLDSARPNFISRGDSQISLGISGLGVSDSEEEAISDEKSGQKPQPDIRSHLQLIPAFSQPRLVYNVAKKFFEHQTDVPSLFPSPAHKTALFRSRYNLIHQRLLRIESFQTPTFAASAKGRVPSLRRSASSVLTTQQAYKITPVANLLGRSGTQHLLLGMLGTAVTGELALTDLTGSIVLDLSEASLEPADALWACPGMLVLVEGVYDEHAGTGGAGRGGVGGILGGRFIAVTVTGPPAEKRDVTLGIKAHGDDMHTLNAGFGWVDFLGVGSDKAVGEQMRRAERRTLKLIKPQEDQTKTARRKMVLLGEVQLDNPRVLEALRRILASYAAMSPDDSPFSFVLIGNFISRPSISGGASGGSIEYKEHFDALASVLAEFPSLLTTTTFVFVPGDNDPWPSAFGAGAATPLPREPVPDLFSSRIRRAFTTANTEAGRTENGGEAMWASNPARLSLFGPVHEIVLFRDDASSRFRRNAILFPHQEKERTAGNEETLNGDSAMTEENIDTQDHAAEGSHQMEVDDDVAEATSHEPQQETSKPDVGSNSASTTRKLVKTFIDQAYLSPFPLSIRPVHWDYAASLHLYPLPTSLVIADADAAPFAVSYEGCHVMNPGRMIDETGSTGGKKGLVRWIEYDARIKKGSVKDLKF